MEGTIHDKATQARFEPCWTSYIGALGGALRPAGLCDLDTSQLMGLTGMAFHLIMHETCDPSSVTVYDWNGEHLSGLDRIGVLSECYFAMPDWTTFPAACRRAVENIKASIDRGIGIVLWGVGIPEFGVVYGYDDADGVFLVDGINAPGTGRVAPILYENVGRSCEVPILYYHIPIERVEYDPGRAYTRSLQFYVAHMERQTGAEAASERASAYRNGLLAYGNWVRALEGGSYNPMGLRYATSVYAEAKGHAARYLAWLAESWSGLPLLPEIATAMGENADVFARMLETLEATEDGAHLGRPVSPAQASAMVPLVKQARKVEERTVALVKRSLEGEKLRTS